MVAVKPPAPAIPIPAPGNKPTIPVLVRFTVTCEPVTTVDTTAIPDPGSFNDIRVDVRFTLVTTRLPASYTAWAFKLPRVAIPPTAVNAPVVVLVLAVGLVKTSWPVLNVPHSPTKGLGTSCVLPPGATSVR